jgi:hypothetical protein
LIVEEPVTISPDRRSLFVKAPVGNSSSVRILVNDSVYVPPEGLKSQAVLTSSQPGPYRIQKCEGSTGSGGNLLQIQTSSGFAEVSLPVGERVSSQEIQRTLRSSPAFDLVLIQDRENALELTDLNKAGTESFIRVAGQGSDSLFFFQKGARGSEVYPSWSLAAKPDPFPGIRPQGFNLVPARYPKFSSPVIGNPRFKVTYASMPERCPRCGGTYVENDWRFNPLGDVLQIQNENLLYQVCLKAILTVRGSNPYHPNYGSNLTRMIGSKATGATALLIQEDVQRVLQGVQNLQNNQRKYQTLSNQEILYRIDSVSVRPSQDDPTVFFVDVTVRNASNRAVQISTVFSVPGTIALAGSNGQTLGLEPTGLTRSQSLSALLNG